MTAFPLYDLSNRPGAEAVEAATDLVVDVEGEGTPVGMEIEDAGEKMDLSRLEVEGLPGLALLTALERQESKAD